MLLAIDTATSTAGLALYAGEPVAEQLWKAGRSHSTQLLGQIDHLLKLVGVEREQLTALAVATGPGSYTGLRVGIAVVQGLAFALGLPAYGVNTLDVLAAAHDAGVPLPIRPVLEAGRSRLATALYRRESGSLARVEEVRGVSIAELIDLVDQPVLVCGDLTREARLLLAERKPRAIVASPAGSLRRPAILAELAWCRYADGEAGDAGRVEPVYLTRA
ncbi:MAG: tRNA (adenosine(37)-N6)-threonylcarbamoyltransferase complex dimerization subunit type 1 TsaB [Chloroflexi bacterium]|nr:tRNA (adenosine(37)-N6)-threonylcarbamoyltransferase complex dimerization subunit type 1 TsaB [Chloroflexota bacterium]